MTQHAEAGDASSTETADVTTPQDTTPEVEAGDGSILAHARRFMERRRAAPEAPTVDKAPLEAAAVAPATPTRTAREAPQPENPEVTELRGQLAHLTTVVEKLAAGMTAPTKPPAGDRDPKPAHKPPSWETRDVLRDAARARLGEWATDAELDEFVGELEDSLVAGRLDVDDAFGDRAKEAQAKLRRRGREYDRFGTVARELAEVRKELAELKAAPQRASARSEALGQVRGYFESPTVELAQAFGTITDVAKAHGLGEQLAEVVVMAALGEADPGDEEKWPRALGKHAARLNATLDAHRKALQAAGPAARDAVFAALAAGHGQRPAYVAVLRALAEGLKDAAPVADAAARGKQAPAPAPAAGEQAEPDAREPLSTTRAEAAFAGPMERHRRMHLKARRWREERQAQD